jgi:hypothetical protein
MTGEQYKGTQNRKKMKTTKAWNLSVQFGVCSTVTWAGKRFGCF